MRAHTHTHPDHLLDSLEVALEEVRLVALDLAVLDGTVVEVGVELDRLVGRRAVLILRRVLPNPEVNVPRQLLRVRVLLVRLKQNFVGSCQCVSECVCMRCVCVCGV